MLTLFPRTGQMLMLPMICLGPISLAGPIGFYFPWRSMPGECHLLPTMRGKPALAISGISKNVASGGTPW